MGSHVGVYRGADHRALERCKSSAAGSKYQESQMDEDVVRIISVWSTFWQVFAIVIHPVISWQEQIEESTLVNADHEKTLHVSKHMTNVG